MREARSDKARLPPMQCRILQATGPGMETVEGNSNSIAAPLSTAERVLEAWSGPRQDRNLAVTRLQRELGLPRQVPSISQAFTTQNAVAMQHCSTATVGGSRSKSVFDLGFCRSRSDTSVGRSCRSISICRGHTIGHSDLLASDSRAKYLLVVSMERSTAP